MVVVHLPAQTPSAVGSVVLVLFLCVGAVFVCCCCFCVFVLCLCWCCFLCAGAAPLVLPSVCDLFWLGLRRPSKCNTEH